MISGQELDAESRPSSGRRARYPCLPIAIFFYTDTLRRIRMNPPTAPPTVDSTSRNPDNIPNPISIIPARNSGEYQNLFVSGGCGAIAAAFSNPS
jgi:hypothetical protein